MNIIKGILIDLGITKFLNYFLKPFNKKVLLEMEVKPDFYHLTDQMHVIVRKCKNEGLDFQQSYEQIEKSLEDEGIMLHGWQRFFRKVWIQETQKELDK